MNTTVTFTDCTNADLIKIGKVNALISANWEFEQWLLQQRKHQVRNVDEENMFKQLFDKYFSIMSSNNISLEEIAE
jgi:hypothetical protein